MANPELSVHGEPPSTRRDTSGPTVLPFDGCFSVIGLDMGFDWIRGRRLNAVLGPIWARRYGGPSLWRLFAAPIKSMSVTLSWWLSLRDKAVAPAERDQTRNRMEATNSAHIPDWASSTNRFRGLAGWDHGELGLYDPEALSPSYLYIRASREWAFNLSSVALTIRSCRNLICYSTDLQSWH
ncbi:hypothetical protein BDW66DRAFT_131099 [Aspergillus desertorum]